MKQIIIILLLAIELFSQTTAWECEVTKKVVTVKNTVKSWDLVSNMHTIETNDTIQLMNMQTGEINVFSLNPNVKVGKTCKALKLPYDKSQNSCVGEISTDWAKLILKGKVPNNVLNMILDTISFNGLINMITDRESAIETLYLRNGYGERYLSNGSQNSFELEITRDDDYYMKANNGIITPSTISLNKKNKTYEMTMDASWMNAYFTINGTCEYLY